MRVFAFALEGVSDCIERLGEGGNFARNKQIGILRSHRMPVHTLSSDGHFRHEISSTNCDTFGCKATQRDPAYHAVFCCNSFLVEESTELLSLRIGRNTRRQSHSKTLLASALDAFARARPCSGPAMEVVQPWRGAVQADLQDNSISRQRSQAFRARPGK